MLKLLKQIPQKYRLWALLATGTLLYFLANIQRVAIPGSIFDELQSEFGVSAPYVTALGPAFMYVYALNQLVIGLLADRYGGARVILGGALLFCLGSVIFPFSKSLPILYLSRALVGLGASTLYLSLVKEIIHAFHKNYIIMISVMIVIGYAGGIIAGAPFVACVSQIGWRITLKTIAIAACLFYLLYALAFSTLPKPAVENIPFHPRIFLRVLRKKHNRNLFLFSGINFGLYYVIQTVIGKKFLEDFCQMEAAPAALILSIMGVISALSGLCFAFLSRMTGNRRQIFVRISGIMCVFVFASVTCLILLGERGQWIAGLLCLLSLTASTSSIVIPLLRETNTTDITGVSVSFLNFSFFITVALLGNLTGFLMNLFSPEVRDGIRVYPPQSYLMVFSVLFALSCLVVWNSLQLRETKGENVADSTF